MQNQKSAKHLIRKQNTIYSNYVSHNIHNNILVSIPLTVAGGLNKEVVFIIIIFSLVHKKNILFYYSNFEIIMSITPHMAISAKLCVLLFPLSMFLRSVLISFRIVLQLDIYRKLEIA